MLEFNELWSVNVEVRLDGDVVGNIVNVGKTKLEGYHYRPKGCSLKFAGETFPTVEDVKRDVIGDE